MIFERGLKRTVNYLTMAGRKVLVVEDVPDIGWIVPQHEGVRAAFGTPTPPRPTLADYRARNGFANDMLETMRLRGLIHTFNPAPSLCKRECATVANGAPLYFDGNHLTKAGSKLVFTNSMAEYLQVGTTP